MNTMNELSQYFKLLDEWLSDSIELAKTCQNVGGYKMSSEQTLIELAVKLRDIKEACNISEKAIYFDANKIILDMEKDGLIDMKKLINDYLYNLESEVCNQKSTITQAKTLMLAAKHSPYKEHINNQFDKFIEENK